MAILCWAAKNSLRGTECLVGSLAVGSEDPYLERMSSRFLASILTWIECPVGPLAVGSEDPYLKRMSSRF